MAGPPIAYSLRGKQQPESPSGPRSQRPGTASGAGGASAVVVVHGIGQQDANATLADAVAGLRREFGETRHIQLRKARIDGEALSCAEMEVPAGKDGGRESVHVYEAYWAPLTAGKATLRSCMRFLVRAGWEGVKRSVSGRHKRLLFNKALPPTKGSLLRAFVFLFLLLVIVSLFVLNATLTAIVGTLVARQATALQDGGWPGPALLFDLTKALLVFVVAGIAFSFWMLMTRWQVKRLRKAPASGDTLPKAPRATRFLSSSGMVVFYATLACLVGTAAMFAIELADKDVPSAVEGGVVDPVQGAVAPVAKPISKEVYWIAALWLALFLLSLRIRRIIVDYVGDLVVYIGTPGHMRGSEGRKEILESVTATLRRVYSARAPDGSFQYGRVAIVGHSLGSVISYDALNALISEDLAEGEAGQVIDRTRLLLTFGSPLDKVAFIFGYQGDEVRRLLDVSEKPLILDYRYRRFPWVNVHAPADIVSAALDLYDLDGKEAPAGRSVRNEADPHALSPLAAHNEYWGNRLVWRRVREALSAPPPGAMVEVAPMTSPRMMA